MVRDVQPKGFKSAWSAIIRSTTKMSTAMMAPMIAVVANQ
jgi:hypothetical protein